MYKVALLKEDEYNILLVISNGRLGIIKSKDELDIHDDTLERLYKVTTYEKRPDLLLETLYKGEVKYFEEEQIVSQSGLVIDKFDNVIILYKPVIRWHHVDDNKLCIEYNVNSREDPEYVNIVVTDELNNYIMYRNNNKIVVLNNLPYEICKIY